MSNMLYACSILYKTKLPMILVFNKTDVKDASFAKEWMTDYEAFSAALDQEESGNGSGGDEFAGTGPSGSGYMGSLLNSMSLMLEEFYTHLSVVAVSSMTGLGVDEFFESVKEKAEEFQRDYQPEIDRLRKEKEERKLQERQKEVDKMMKGMKVQGGTRGGQVDADKDSDEMSLVSGENDDDDDDDGPDAEYDREGLQARYEAAMSGERDSTGAEASFAKYLHSQRQ